MKLLSSLETSLSGMTAHRLWLDLVADNLANVNTTRSADGEGPYLRKVPIFQEKLERAVEGGAGAGVAVTEVRSDSSAVRKVYDPGHPDADEEGYVTMPDINVVNEMVSLMIASRGFEANVTAINAGKSMALKAMEILSR